MNSKGSLITLFFISLFFLYGGWWLQNRSKEAPDVTFATITGKKIHLKKLKGKPVLITFWATDCPECIKEIPHLIEVYNEFHEKGLEMIAVTMFYDPPNRVVAMSKATRLPYHVAIDLQAQNAIAFGDVRLTPTTFLINPDSKIVMRSTGLFDVQDVKKRIKTMLEG